MSVGLLIQEMRRTYAAQRGVSLGASVTLAAVSGGWAARFECARRCSAILGTRNLENDVLLISMEDIHKSILKLTETLSIALVDTVTDDKGSRFVLVWRIAPTTRKEVTPCSTDEHIILTPKDGPAVVVKVPVIPATGETITSEEVEDALDEY
jgi:hypothetical protein